MTVFCFSNVIRGHHIYKLVWSPVVGEVLKLRPEDGNEYNRYVVGVQKDGKIIGHAPKEITRIFYYFMQQNGTINDEVM